MIPLELNGADPHSQTPGFPEMGARITLPLSPHWLLGAGFGTGLVSGPERPCTSPASVYSSAQWGGCASCQAVLKRQGKDMGTEAVRVIRGRMGHEHSPTLGNMHGGVGSSTQKEVETRNES